MVFAWLINYLNGEFSMEDTIKYIRPAGIVEKYGISNSTVWRWSAEGKLPKPIGKLSPKITVWDSAEVEIAMTKILSDNSESDNNVVAFSSGG